MMKKYKTKNASNLKNFTNLTNLTNLTKFQLPPWGIEGAISK
jgi:hypothetical protein